MAYLSPSLDPHILLEGESFLRKYRDCDPWQSWTQIADATFSWGEQNSVLT